jgi:hypothetical protein
VLAARLRGLEDLGERRKAILGLGRTHAETRDVMRPHERYRERAGRARATRGRSRLLAEREDALALLDLVGRDEVAGEPRVEARPERVVDRRAHARRFLEHRAHGRLDATPLRKRPRIDQRRPREGRGVGRAAASRQDLFAPGAGRGHVAGAAERAGQREPELDCAPRIEEAGACPKIERDLVEPDGFFPAEPAGGELTAAAGVVESPAQGVRRADGRQMVHDLGRHHLRRRRLAFERGRDARVPRRARRRREIVDQHAPDERVREAEAALAAFGLDEDAFAERAREMIGGTRRRVRRRRLAEDLAQHARVDDVAEERASREDGAALVAEAAQSARDDVARAVGHASRVAVGPEILLGDQQLHDLADEEGVAVGFAMKRVAEGGGVAAGTRRGDPIGAMLRGKAGQRQATRDRFAGEVRKRGGEGVIAIDLGVAIRSDDEEPCVLQVGRDELEQLQRRAVGPVEVVEHDDEAVLPGHGREKAAHDVEEPETRALRVRAVAYGEVRQAFAQHGEDVHQLRRPRAGRRDRGLEADLIDPAPERGVPGPEGRCRAVLPAASPPQRDAARLRFGGEHAGEPRLPDAGLPGEQSDAAAPGQRARERGLELGDFPFTIDERDLIHGYSVRASSAGRRIAPVKNPTSCFMEAKRIASPDATISTRPVRRPRDSPTGSNWTTNARSVDLLPVGLLMMGRTVVLLGRASPSRPVRVRLNSRIERRRWTSGSTVSASTTTTAAWQMHPARSH